MDDNEPRSWESCLKQLIPGVLLVFVGLGVIGYNWRWIRTALAGPVAISPADLIGVSDPATLPSPYVRIPYDQIVETKLGISNVDAKTGQEQTRKSRFLLARVDNRWLVVETTWYNEGTELVGYLLVWKDSLHQEAVNRLREQFPAHAGGFLKVHLDADYEYRGHCYVLLAVVGFVFIGSFILVVGGLRSMPRSARPRKRRPPQRRDDEDSDDRPRQRKKRSPRDTGLR